MVRLILAAVYEHADAHLNRAQQAIVAKNAADAKSLIEALAVDVGQLATEGDNSVGAVRKRLMLGGPITMPPESRRGSSKRAT